MKALIVDDDRALADLLAFTLRRAGFETHLAFDTAGAMRAFEADPPDVIVLDLNLPGQPGLKDGFAVCRAIRQTSEVPIILLTVRAEEEDVLRGLETGADDYVLKPFSPRQLVARIQAVSRRSAAGRASGAAPLSHRNLHFNPSMREVHREGQAPVALTRLEARLLEYFMLNPNFILPSGDLIAHVWGPDAGSDEMLRQLVRRLRTKIERDPAQPELILNVPSLGYGFAIKS
jgi:DNA-binding response OmpR family regulator